MKASDPAIEAALASDTVYPYIWDSSRDIVPVFDPPIHLRPCCAFGKDLEVKVGEFPIPIYRVANIVDYDKLGRHVYDAGFAGKGIYSEKKAKENNGLIYTCRGGFIDTAHVRDYADWTVFLAHEIYRNLGQAMTIELPPEIGHRQIVLHQVDLSVISSFEQIILSATLASWTAYHLSVWHEIAQWHGYGTFAPIFPEYTSAYSPEDLFSNMLGTKIAAALILSFTTTSDQLYAHNFDKWLKNTLRVLGAVPEQSTRAYIDAVDKSWWDSTMRIPEKYLVLERVYDVGLSQRPKLVPDQLVKAAENLENFSCESSVEPIQLSIASSLYGFKMSDLATLQVIIPTKHYGLFSLSSNSYKEGRMITQADFQHITDAARDYDELEYKEHYKNRSNKP